MSEVLLNINNVSTNVYMSKRIKENVFQDILHVNGKGITEQVEDTDASTIRFIKFTPLTTSARRLGASKNGAAFTENAASTPTTMEYIMNLTFFYDDNMDVPEVEQDMLSVSILDGALQNIAGRINTEINASTIATQIVASLTYAQANSSVNLVKMSTTSTTPYFDGFLSACSVLDSGDKDNGIQYFDNNQRQALVRSSYRWNLLSQAGVIVGGSNIAQEMIARGIISPTANGGDLSKQYVGEVANVPCYMVSDLVMSRAEEWTVKGTTASGSTTYAQLTAGSYDGIVMLLCASVGTDRGIATGNKIKTIDSPNGAGIRLQPKWRWGVNVAYPKSIVLVAESTFTNIVTSTVSLSTEAVGSQSFS